MCVLNKACELCFFRLFLQCLKMNSRIITILGIVFSVIGLTIMADWQSIPYDPCTEYSLYHHPELSRKYSSDSLPVAFVNQQKFEALWAQIVDNAIYKMAMNNGESQLPLQKSICYIDISICHQSCNC